METDINLPFITADASGPEAPQRQALPVEVRADDRAARGSGPSSPADRRSRMPASRPRTWTRWSWSEDRPGSRWCSKAGRRVLRQGAPQGRQPGRGGGDRCRGPGRRPGRRGQGRAAARRDAAVPGCRDPGRRDRRGDPAQHDHSDPEEQGLLDRGRQPEPGRDPRSPGRAADGGRQPDPRSLPPDRDSAGAARRAADRGDLRHRRQRHPARVGQGPRHRPGAEDPDHQLVRPVRRGDRADGDRGPDARVG